MESPNPAATKTTALFSIRLTADTDAILLGKAFADFTLPQEQIGTRMFAVQLFHETASKKKVTDNYLGSYIESKIEGNTVSFGLDVPKFQIKKDEVWLIVLYGEDVPPSGSPSASPNASPSGSPSASPSGSPSASPSVKPSDNP